MRLNKKAMELPLNIVIMMIIGLVLFGIGFSMFASFSSEGADTIDNLNSKIKNNIASLECQGDEWICAPSVRIRNGRNGDYNVFVANRGDTDKSFGIKIDLETSSSGDRQVISNDCGEVIVYYPDISVPIQRGQSASFPFTIYTDRVRTAPCSFTTIVETTPDNYKTPLIIRVE